MRLSDALLSFSVSRSSANVCRLCTAMNTSRYAESYRIQTYAEYLQSRQQSTHTTSKRWTNDGWADTSYSSAASASGFSR